MSSVLVIGLFGMYLAERLARARHAVQVVMMAFFGEYLARLLDDHSERADYSGVFEKNSAVMVDVDRRNVIAESSISERNPVQSDVVNR